MNRLKYKLNQLNFLINHSKTSKGIIEDIYGLSHINNLLARHPILPFTEKTLRPFVLQFLVNEIIINQRSAIVEFGSGISTIIMARLFALNNIEGSIYSFEHDKDWCELLGRLLNNENLSQYVNLIHTPLVQKQNSLVKGQWYDTSNISTEEINYDLVLIDGPPAFQKEVEMSRYFALPYVIDKLSSQCAIMLDDAQRSGETKVLKKWKEEFGLNFKIYSNTMAVAYKGAYFVSNPLKGNE